MKNTPRPELILALLYEKVNACAVFGSENGLFGSGTDFFQGFLFFVTLTVFLGSDTLEFLKDLCKITAFPESALSCDLRYGKVGGVKEIGCLLDPEKVKVAYGRKMGQGEEYLTEIPCVHSRNGGKSVKGKLLLIVAFNILKHRLYSF